MSPLLYIYIYTEIVTCIYIYISAKRIQTKGTFSIFKGQDVTYVPQV